MTGVAPLSEQTVPQRRSVDPFAGHRSVAGVLPIAAVMVHAPEVDAALAWYERAFPEARRVRIWGNCIGLRGPGVTQGTLLTPTKAA